jgi:hypothetical protein
MMIESKTRRKIEKQFVESHIIMRRLHNPETEPNLAPSPVD